MLDDRRLDAKVPQKIADYHVLLLTRQHHASSVSCHTTVAAIAVSHVNTRIIAYTKLVLAACVAATSISRVKVLLVAEVEAVQLLRLIC